MNIQKGAYAIYGKSQWFGFNLFLKKPFMNTSFAGAFSRLAGDLWKNNTRKRLGRYIIPIFSRSDRPEDWEKR